jgi:iron complex outermembrane receptor protein
MDLEQSNVFMRLTKSIGAFDLAATAFHVTGERGVAPESDRDPTQHRVRYWRYPETDYSMGILSLNHTGAGGDQFSATLATQWFGQTIDSYASDAYTQIEDRQIDDDHSWSFRAIYSHDWGPAHLNWSVNGLQTEHRQEELEFGNEASSENELFRGRSMTIGGDAEIDLEQAVVLNAGAGLDWVDAPETGGRAALDAFWEPRLSAGLGWQASSDVNLRVGVGRQSRIPSLRELYGTAINRFLENPNLKPERITLLEAALSWAPSWGDVEITPFARFSKDLIDQRVVTVDGQSLRQRINLAASRIAGVEFSTTAQLSEQWSAFGHFTWQHARSRDRAEGAFDIPLSERPDILVRGGLSYSHSSGLAARVEAIHRGLAYSPDADGERIRLSASTVLNARLSYDLSVLFEQLPQSEIYIHTNNIMDAEVIPQLGLPNPGREMRGGVRLSF